MKQLTCEMCGSTELLKQDGLFVCQTCGAKYSVEEAKKMMVEVDSTPMIDNYLEIARNARESGNNQEAELYVNKILEIDPNHAEAWLLKGCTSGWQSTLGNLRFWESINCWQKALQYANDIQKEEFCEIITFNTTGLGEAVISLIMDNFANYPNKGDSAKVKNLISEIEDFYAKVGNLNAEIEIDELETWTNICRAINDACVEAYEYTHQQYGPEDSDKNKYSYATYKDRMNEIIDILNLAILECSKGSIGLLNTAYKNIKFYIAMLEHSFCYSFKTYSSGSGYYYDTGLTDDEKQKLKMKSDATDYMREKSAEKCVENMFVDATDEGVLQEVIHCILFDNYSLLTANDYLKYYISRQKEVSGAVKIIQAVIYANCPIIRNSFKAIELVKEAMMLNENGVGGSEFEKEQMTEVLNYVDEEEDDARTLLMISSAHCNVECVNYLISLGADVNAKCDGVTALWFVARKPVEEENLEKSREIAKMLLDKGADIDVVNKNNVALYNSQTDYEIARMICEKYPDAQRGDAPANSSSSTGSGGCYVATAVYGSYDCPQVWTLRRYRDNTLASTWYGRAFIRTYYAISPTLVKWFGETAWFKKMWQGKLDKMVEKLQSEGFESTPYEDKNW